MSSTSSNTEEFTYNELMEQYVKATRLIEHLKSQRDRSKRAFDKAMDLVLKYDARIAELEAVINMATNQSNNLRPCPFCGNEPVVEGNLVACNNLNCPTYDNYWTDPMIFTCDQWNTRPVEGALNARIAELEGFIGQLIEAGNDIALIANDILEFDGKSGEFTPIAEKWQALVKNRKEV